MPKALAAVVMIGSIRPFEIYRKSDQDPALCRLDAPVLPTLCPRPPTRACIVGSVRTKQLLVYVYYVVLPSVQLCCDLLDGDWCECLICDSSGI